jgi:hypothetical protein
MRLRPIWLEEAGPAPRIGARELARWTEGTHLQIQVSTIVFVPPQLCNLLRYRLARALLRATNWLFRRLPVVRNWGGLVMIEGRMRPADSGLQ